MKKGDRVKIDWTDSLNINDAGIPLFSYDKDHIFVIESVGIETCKLEGVPAYWFFKRFKLYNFKEVCKELL